MLEAGEDARFIARRMVMLASEDIGNADPRALLVAVAAAQAVEHVGLPEARLNLAQAAIYLALAPKSNASYVALKEATADVRELGQTRPPDALRDAHYRGARKLGRGKGYVYPHDDPGGFEAEHLPEPLRGKRYYRRAAPAREGAAEQKAGGRSGSAGRRDEQGRRHTSPRSPLGSFCWPGPVGVIQAAGRRRIPVAPAQPAWIDYGDKWVPFRRLFFQPGLTVALAHNAPAAEARRGGAQLASGT